MKSWIWLRGLAIVLVVLTLGHTLGFLTPPRDNPQAAVFSTMGRVHFPVMGIERTYGDFYRGFGLFVSVQFLLLAAIAVQTGSIARHQPRAALPLAVTLLVGCVGSAVLSWMYLFRGPIVMSLVAVVWAAGACVALAHKVQTETV